MTLAGALAAALAAFAVVLSYAAQVHRPSSRTHPDARALVDAGWRWSLLRWEALRGALVLAAVLLVLPLGASAVVVVALTALAPSVLVRERASVLRDRARPALTRALVATHAALRSGVSLTEALRGGAEAAANPLARRPFDRALAAFALGAPLDDALRDAALSEPDERTRLALATVALGIAERLPAERLAALVGSVADRWSFDDRLDEEVRARTGGTRAQGALLAVVVPGLAGYLALMTPGIAEILGGPLGRSVLVPGALALEVAGVLLSRRFVSDARR